MNVTLEFLQWTKCFVYPFDIQPDVYSLKPAHAADFPVLLFSSHTISKSDLCIRQFGYSFSRLSAAMSQQTGQPSPTRYFLEVQRVNHAPTKTRLQQRVSIQGVNRDRPRIRIPVAAKLYGQCPLSQHPFSENGYVCIAVILPRRFPRKKYASTRIRWTLKLFLR